jgi:hypothetical protein
LTGRRRLVIICAFLWEKYKLGNAVGKGQHPGSSMKSVCVSTTIHGAPLITRSIPDRQPSFGEFAAARNLHAESGAA